MFVKIVITALVTSLLVLISSDAEKQDCRLVKCINQISCGCDQYLVGSNYKKGICCSYCATETDYNSPTKCQPNKDPSLCNLVDCRPNITCRDDQRLIKAMRQKGICCDCCLNKQTPYKCTEDMTCPTNFICPAGQQLVKADPERYVCCDYCTDCQSCTTT